MIYWSYQYCNYLWLFVLMEFILPWMALISVVEVVVTPTTTVSVVFKWFHLDANIFSCKPPTSSCLQCGCCKGEALIKTEHFLIKRKTGKQHCGLFFAPGRLWQKFHQTAWYIVAHCREAKQVKCHLFHRNVDRNSPAVTNNLLTTKDVWINSGRGFWVFLSSFSLLLSTGSFRNGLLKKFNWLWNQFN